jgi:hypothetical protein
MKYVVVCNIKVDFNEAGSSDTNRVQLTRRLQALGFGKAGSFLTISVTIKCERRDSTMDVVTLSDR